MKYALDTNIFIDGFRNEEAQAEVFVFLSRALPFTYLSAVVMQELAAGALGWWGPDGAMATSILIRTFVADGRRLTLHVGGGITYRSDPAEEWDETVAKAAGPLGAIGGREVSATGE